MSTDKLYDDDYDGKGESLSGPKKRIWAKQDKDEKVYRIIPPLKAWASFFKDGKPGAFFHTHKHSYNPPENEKGYVVYVCPKHADGRNCEDCNEGFELRKTGDEADKELAKQIGAKHVVYVNVIDRDGDPEEALVLELSAPIGVKYAKGFSKFEKLVKVMDGYGKIPAMNVIHPQTGHDIVIMRSGKGQFNTTYEVQGDPAVSPLAVDDEMMMRIIKNQHDLRELVKAPSDEEIAALKERAINFGRGESTGSRRRSATSGAGIDPDDDGGESGIQKQIDDAAGGGSDDDDLAF